jgi:hypothetical protein
LCNKEILEVRGNVHEKRDILAVLNGKKKVDYLEENDGLERRDTRRAQFPNLGGMNYTVLQPRFPHVLLRRDAPARHPDKCFWLMASPRRSLFRPCIDLHDGHVKQIVGGTLSETDPESLKTNFVAKYAREAAVVWV